MTWTGRGMAPMADEDHKDAIAALRAALVELESEEGLASFVEGHGIQSRCFAFTWRGERLEIEIRLPYARVLSDDEEQAADAAKVGAAIRMAILLLAVDGEGRLLAGGEAKLAVTADDFGFRYTTFDAEGLMLDMDDGWEPLVARFESAHPGDDDGIQVIWP